jgi:threonine/homoserine/homoserine lactone efflux protein
VLVEVLNPKTAIFFIAFLPQFVDPAAAFPAWLQFLILGTVVNLVFSSADLVAVSLAHRIVGRISQSLTGQRIARWIGGSVLAGLGLRLGLESSRN